MCIALSLLTTGEHHKLHEGAFTAELLYYYYYNIYIYICYVMLLSFQ